MEKNNHHHHQTGTPRLRRLYHRHYLLITLKKCLLAVVVILLASSSSSFAVMLLPQQHHYSVSRQFTQTSNNNNNNNFDNSHHPGEQLQQREEEEEEIDKPTAKQRRPNNKSIIQIAATTAADDDDDDTYIINSSSSNNDYNEGDDSYHATILRSLYQKHHIEYQYDQIEFQHDSQQRALNTLSRILTRLEHTNNNHINYNDRDNDNDDNDDITIGNNSNNNNNNRKLQNEFENAFGQNKPGSTYGTNMFCGSSWAEASTSCPQRQNCPSGQTSECVMPGHECWAFTECDTRRGDGEQFSEFHNVIPGENLSESGVGAAESGGYVDLSKPSIDKTDHYFCGKGYDDARTRCGTHCPSGNMNDCPHGEICFTNTPCDARMMTIAPAPPSPTERPTTPSPVVYLSKHNKYYCGFDWDDAQERCEVWCPTGSDDDCPDEQVCMAFTACHAVDMNGKTLEQIKQQQEANGPPRTPSPTGADGVPGYYEQTDGGTKRPTRNPTRRPTKRPVLSAEEAMHRFSFCGRFWVDARDNCETKQHCEDDGDCPDAESCWTQTPCDYYATESPTTAPPSRRPTEEPTEPRPTRSPTRR